MIASLLLAACGASADSSASDDSADDGAVATATVDPAPTARGVVATPTPLSLSSADAGDAAGDSADSPTDGDDDGDTVEADASPTAAPTTVPTAEATATTQPMATTEPTATPPPMPTVAPTSQPTAVPQPTATAQPTSTPMPTAAPAVRPTVTCAITPNRAVAVGEALVFQAAQTPSTVAVSYVFDHGDGTVDPQPRSDAYFAAPGVYRVTLGWETPWFSGTVDCGTVTVVGDQGCVIGLGPADGVGWWCGATFCQPGSALAQCPTEAPWGCYTTMMGTRQCIPQQSEPECLVGQGPADGFAWYCDGVWCDPNAPRAGCPPYPIYGCYETVNGFTICIDPPAPPVLSCSISDTSIAVNEIVTFTAIQTGTDVPVDVVFDHGDGTLDPRWVAQAYYAAPGSYPVTLRWTWAGGTRVVSCGTVVVS